MPGDPEHRLDDAGVPDAAGDDLVPDHGFPFLTEAVVRPSGGQKGRGQSRK
jgi:hypothetical protein